MGTLVNPLAKLAPGLGYAGAVQVIDSGDIAVATGDIDLNDLVEVFTARKGQMVVGVLVSSTDLDSNGTPLVTLALGDAGDDDRFLTGSTIGRTAGVDRTLAAAGAFYKFTADTKIYVKVTAAAATAVAGTIRAALLVVNVEV